MYIINIMELCKKNNNKIYKIKMSKEIIEIFHITVVQ